MKLVVSAPRGQGDSPRELSVVRKVFPPASTRCGLAEGTPSHMPTDDVGHLRASNHQLEALHKVMWWAMKYKQFTDVANAEALTAAAECSSHLASTI